MNWLRRNEWNIVIAVALIALALGLLGVRAWHVEQGKTVGLWDQLYFCVRLFMFNYDLTGSGTPYAPAPWPLLVAKYLAPATVFYAGVKAFLAATAEQLGIWRMRRWKRHAVVCGAGKRGALIARTLASQGRKVVVVEKEAELESLSTLRAAGIRVLTGSAAGPERMHQARMGQASLIVIVTSSPETNLEVALAAGRMSEAVEGETLILAHAPFDFSSVFEGLPLFARIKRNVRARFFSHEATAARVLAQEFLPPLAASLADTPRAAGILIAGDSAILGELTAVLTVQCQFPDCGPPKIRILTPNPEAIGGRFPLHHPQLPHVAEMELVGVATHELTAMDVPFLSGGQTWDLAFVACQDDMATINLATRLIQSQATAGGVVVACLRPSTNLDPALRTACSADGLLIRNVAALGCGVDDLVIGKLDNEARQLHERYYHGEIAKGRSPGETPALVEWELLPESLREANRNQVDHQPIKRLALARSTSPEALEALAEAEHRRWMADRITAGWRRGEPRDDARKLHPSLRSYQDLTEEEKDKDRATVATVPRSLEAKKQP
jgi:voltage-gated potassium channel Kch